MIFLNTRGMTGAGVEVRGRHGSAAYSPWQTRMRKPAWGGARHVAVAAWLRGAAAPTNAKAEDGEGRQRAELASDISPSPRYMGPQQNFHLIASPCHSTCYPLIPSLYPTRQLSLARRLQFDVGSWLSGWLLSVSK